MIGAAGALAAVVDGDEGAGVDEATERASNTAESFLAAIVAAQQLPPVPDPAARASFARTLTLWRTGAELHLVSLRPLDGEASARAADLIGEGADEFTRFASFFSGGQ